MKEKIKHQLVDYLKTNKVLQPLYVKLNRLKPASSFLIDSVKGISFSTEDTAKIRVTLVLPTLRRTLVFGGIYTAICFFELLVNQFQADGRILVLSNEAGDSKWQYPVSGYRMGDSHRQIEYAPQLKSVGIRENEIVILTSWVTAYAMLPLVRWKKEVCGDDAFKLVYFIQDYEPGFYPWSVEYALAELTYSEAPDSMISVINSEQLYDYMKLGGYHFYRMMYFEPVLNEKLKKILTSCRHVGKRKKQIIIYGRPTTYRNAFEIIRYSLQQWSRTFQEASEWTILSLGEGYEKIKLENNDIRVLGKTSIEEYARIMLESYAGISLMISPHPSYPPLEMSTFGVRTITNCFANKDLAGFNKNIISLPNCDPEKIAKTLCTICEEYETFRSECDLNECYLDNSTMRQCAEEVYKAWNDVKR